MPTYEYACRDCGEHLEVVQSFKDDALTTCPACRGSLRKVFSAAGLIFKGSGWHIKDYASTKPAATSTSSPEPSATKSSADSGTSDAGSAASSTSSKDASSKDSTSAPARKSA